RYVRSRRICIITTFAVSRRAFASPNSVLITWILLSSSPRWRSTCEVACACPAHGSYGHPPVGDGDAPQSIDSRAAEQQYLVTPHASTRQAPLGRAGLPVAP